MPEDGLDMAAAPPPPDDTPPAPAPQPAVEPQPQRSKYADSVDSFVGAQRALLASSVEAGVQTDPDRHAKVLALAEQTGLAPDAVAADFDNVTQRVRRSGVDTLTLLQRHPELASWLSNKDNASIALDDVPTLRHLDVAMRSLAGEDPTGVLPPGYKFHKDGTILGPAVEGQATVYNSLTDLRKEFERRNDVAAIQELNRQASAASLSATYGPAANLAAGFQANLAGTVVAAKRLLGLPTERERQGISEITADSMELDPGFLGDLERGVGGLAADAPLMLLGGPLAKGAESLLAVKGAAGVLAPIARSKYLTEAFKVGAMMQPTAVKAGLNAGAEHGALVGLSEWAINSAVPAAFGRTGLAHAIVPGAEAAAADGYAGAAKRLLLDGGFQATNNAATEFATSLRDYAMGVDPNALEPGTLVRRLASAGALGAVAGAAFNVPHALGDVHYRRLVAANGAIHFADRLGSAVELATASATGERSPERLQQLLNQLSPESAGTVYYQGEEWAQAWQKLGVDPQAKADEMGVGKDFRTALHTGGEMGVPTGELVRHAADAARNGGDPTDLLMHVRQVPGASSAAEGVVFHQGAQKDVEQLFGEVQQAAEDAKAGTGPGDPIYEHMLEQAISAGRSKDEATQHAQLTAAVFRTLAKRSGADPVAEYEKYRLSVREEQAAALKPGSTTVVDALINRLRAGDVPSAAKVHGESLVPWLRRKGLQDPGGDLKSLEVDRELKPGQKKLINPEGLGLDIAAQHAHAEGFIADTDPNTLIAAIDAEAKGKPSYRLQPADPTLAAIRDGLEELQAQITAAGVDLKNEPSNDAVKAAIGDAAARAELDILTKFDQRLEVPSAFLKHEYLLKQWKKAHGDRSPTPTDKDWQKLVRQAGMVDEAQGRRFDQPSRGSIYIDALRHFTVVLRSGADLSTLAHESAHFYLEALGDFAERAEAEPGLQQDYQTVLDWLGVKTRAEIGTAQHEQFARGWERYLYEGKAPSAEMRGVFARFALWMAHVYKTIKALAVDLTPEVRGVFDRMLASEEAINAARADLSPDDTAYRAIMSPEEYARYKSHKDKATAKAMDRVFSKAMAVIRREQSKEHKAELAKEVETITPAINRRPVYVAESALKRGLDADGKELPAKVKLDRREVVREFGKDGPGKLPRGVTSDEEGAHVLSLQEAADLFGFQTGAQLWEALANIKPREAVIKAEAEANVKARRPDLLSDGTMAEEAMAAVHNKVRGDVLDAEALALAVKAGRRAMPMEQIRIVAKRLIDEMPAGKITPNLYLRAERRFGRESFDLLNKGKHGEALDAKKQEMLNYALYEAAAAARETVQDGITFLKAMGKPAAQERLGKAGGQSWVARGADGAVLKVFDNEMDATEFAQNQGATLEREGGFRDAMNAMIDQLRKGWRTMPYAQAAALIDIARSIEHQATNAFTLKRIADKAEVADVISELAGIAKQTGAKRQRNASPGTWDGVARFLRNADAIHTKLSFVARRMDGFKDGGRWWELFVRPINEAGDQEVARKNATVDQLQGLYKEWGKGGIGQPSVYKPRYLAAINDHISHMGRIMVALNWGALENRERVLSGHGWEDSQAQAVLDTLDAADWKLVTGIWKLIGSFKGEVWAQEERLRGVPPKAVEAVPIQTKFGMVEGGYFPIKYDADASARASDQLTTDQAMAGKVLAAGRGYTKARVETTGRRIKLDDGVITQHLGEVIHRLTHEDALADIRKLINHRDLQGTIVDYFGMDAYRIIRDTLGDVAQGEGRAEHALERAARFLRTGVSSATMGFNISSAAMQVTGITQSIQRTGWTWFARGVGRMLGDASTMESTAKFIAEKSTMMRNRYTNATFHRDLRDNLDGVGARKLAAPIRKNLFYMMQKMQQLVDMPTWLGAYDKARAEFPEDDAKAVAIADQTVLDTQGGGQTKDLAKIQRGNEFLRLFTVFYHFFNTTYNLGSEAIRSKNYRSPADIAKLGVDFLMLVSAPVVLTAALKAATRGAPAQGDDPKEWAKKLAGDHLQYLLSTFVLGRELSGGTDGFSYEGPAGTRGLSALSDLIAFGFGKADDHKAERAATAAAGILFHLPTAQAQRLIEGYQWAQENHANPAVPMLFGKPYEQGRGP